MKAKVFARFLFFPWIAAITILSVVPHSNDGMMVSSNFTTSGVEKHIMGYFIAALLFHYAFRRDYFFSILISGCYIFFYSLLLEIIQFYLPYRSYNTTDLLANAVGIILFIFIWIGCTKIFTAVREP
jgi:VanZ family protein